MEQKFEILIVDDDVNLASNLDDILTSEGCNTVAVYDGKTALTLCRKKMFDLALIDIKLPDIRGLELVDELSRLASGMTYIIITGYASLDSAIEAVNHSSILAYETKPLNMEHILALTRQLKKRKEVEKALKESEERLTNFVESSPDSFALFDSELNYVVVNKAGLGTFGLTKEEIIGKNILEINPELKETGTYDKYLEVVKTGTPFYIDDLVPHPRFGDIHLSVRAFKVGEGLGVIATDITEQKWWEEEKLKLQQKAQLTSRLASIGEMASGIAHEINNPLTSIVGFSQLLMEKDTSEDIREDIKVIADAGQRMASIVKRLSTFARQYGPVKTLIDVNEIIKIVLELRKYELETGNIRVTTKLDPELPWTMTDGGQLQQVFLNIIINAEREMRSAHDKGKLFIKTEQIDNTIRISFKDDGPGIAQENMDKLFDPFFTTKDVGEGAGLGLSLSYGIVTEHGGKLYAESELGKGATFFVELPILTEEKQPESAEPPDEEVEKIASAKILVVDDEQDIRRFLNRVLGSEGHEVETVDNAADALGMIKDKGYDIILLDIRLPGMSGIEFYERLKDIAPSLVKSIVFITGDTLARDTQDFLAKTKAPYIAKPLDVEELRKDINRILSEGI